MRGAVLAPGHVKGHHPVEHVALVIALRQQGQVAGVALVLVAPSGFVHLLARRMRKIMLVGRGAPVGVYNAVEVFTRQGSHYM